MTDKTNPDSEKPEAKDFSVFLIEQNRGRTHAELSEGLHDLIAKVQDTGKKGSITATFTVEPLKGDTNTLAVTDAIKLKLPEHDRGGSIFYVDKQGNPSRNDPNQMSLADLAEVPSNVDPATGEIQE